MEIKSDREVQMTKVLVVDDDPDLAIICSIILEDAGYEIAVAHNGFEAYDRLADANPDVVLLDVMMPVLDGLTVCKMVKRNPRTKDLPVIVMSASQSLRDQARSCHADAILAKPFDIDMLVSTVEQFAYSK